MAASKVISGYGTTLYTDMATPDTFAKLALEILSVGGPPMSVDMADATHAESDEGFEEVIPTIIRTGNMTINVNHVQDSAAIAAVIARMKLKTSFQWQLRLPPPPAGSTQKMYSGVGYWNGVDPGNPHDGKMTLNLSLRLTGPVDGPDNLPS